MGIVFANFALEPSISIARLYMVMVTLLYWLFYSSFPMTGLSKDGPRYLWVPSTMSSDWCCSNICLLNAMESRFIFLQLQPSPVILNSGFISESADELLKITNAEASFPYDGMSSSTVPLLKKQ